MEEIILTKEGKEKLEQELDFLETTKREEISERIKTAREFGDLSENSEYDDAKNEQALIEKRIAEIHQILINSKMAKKPKKNTGEISVGSVVKVLMGKKETTFNLVGGSESDVANGKISYSSPVGEAIIGHKKGDKINTTGPTGMKLAIEILDVK